MAANPQVIATGAKEQAFEVEQIGTTIGAEIHGLDLTRQLGPETFARLEAALVEHKVVYARGQDITPEQHVAIGKRFGELEVHPFHRVGEAPQLMVLDNHKDNPVLSTDIWHSDTTFRETPTKYSILRATILPKLGGDTLWADMTAAYDNLADPMKRMLDGLKAKHDFWTFRRLFTKSDEDQARLREIEQRLPNPTHPVVRTHPVTGRKAVYVNALFTIGIEGMSTEESRALLAFLCELPRVPEYQFRIRWQPGTLVFWDNRSTQHYACNDYYPNRRRMERVAVVGDRPY
ncbi:MAG: TauD/TfdA family dioxygenase [Betaproteobacteria bacterium]